MTDPAAAATALDERYGRTPERRRRGTRLAWLLGAAIAAVFAAWVIWAGLLVPAASIEYSTIAYTVDVADSTVEVRWQLSLDTRSAAHCAVQALDDNYSVIGWKVVDIPASDQHTRSFRETIRTTEPANTGLVYRCWVA